MTPALRRAWAKDLDAATLYALLRLRVEVFVVEQACPYPELDGRDLLAETRHFWLELPGPGGAGPRTPGRPALAEPGAGPVVATLRLMEEHPGGVKEFRIGRVCTRRDQRGAGHAARLLTAALAEVGTHPCRIDAQIYLAEMYARHGFVADGPQFSEDGIPHLPMRRVAGRGDGAR